MPGCEPPGAYQEVSVNIDPKAAYWLGVAPELSTDDLTVAVLAAAVRRPQDWGGDLEDLADWLGCSEAEAEPTFTVLDSLRPYLAAISASCFSARGLLDHLASGGRAYYAAYVGPMVEANVPSQLIIADSAAAAVAAIYDGSGCSDIEAEHEVGGRWTVSGTSSLGEAFTEQWDVERVRM